MNNKKFVGFMIMGTKTQQAALEGKGLILWMQEKPSWINRFYNKLFLGIRWVDKEDFAPITPPVEEATTKVEMPKQRSYKAKTSDGANKTRRNTTASTPSDKE